MKHLFIVNPTAGGKDRSEEIRARAEEIFARRGGEFEVYVTTGPMDAADEIKRRASDGEEYRVYACGGDGTFNECAHGAAKLKNVAVCPYPAGTGNDFCRMFGDEKDLFLDLEALIDGSVHPIDLIDCNGRYSANICSVGIDARIGCDVHKYSNLPVIGGAAGYVVSLIVNVFAGISQNMSIDCAGRHFEGEHSLVSVCNGRYYGGGFNPSLDARPDDGDLDIYIVKGMGILTLARLIGKYSSGRADEIPSHVTHLHGTELKIKLDRTDVINVDGEALRSDEINMKLAPHALNLIVPKGMKFFE